MSQARIRDFAKTLPDIFDCALCKNLLTVPIMLVQDLGNVCGTCLSMKTEGEDRISIPNTSFEAILKKLTIPCRHQINGCHRALEYLKLRAHEDKCEFRAVECLFSADGCDWVGTIEELPEHFQENHEEHLFDIVNDNKFILEVNTSNAVNVVRMLKNDYRSGFLVIKNLQTLGCLVHFLYFDTVNVNTSKFTLKYVGNSIKYKTKCNVLSLNVISNSNTDISLGTSVSVHALKELLEREPDNKTITLVVKTQSNLKLGKTVNFLTNFECPVCKNLMKPPIYLCSSGHSLCNICQPKLSVCPECRSEMSDSRNYRLETFCEELLYPCVNHIRGCNEVFKLNESTIHENGCLFRKFVCPILFCKYESCHRDIENHFRFKHPSEEWSNETEIEFKHKLNGDYPDALKVWGPYKNLYEINISIRGDTIYYNLEMLNTYNKNKYTYVYEIQIVNNKNSVFPNLVSCRFLNHCIRFDLDELGAYADKTSDKLCCVCKIIKISNEE